MAEAVNIVEMERFVQEMREFFTDAPEFETIREINQYMTTIEKNYRERQKMYLATVGGPSPSPLLSPPSFWTVILH